MSRVCLFVCACVVRDCREITCLCSQIKFVLCACVCACVPERVGAVVFPETTQGRRALVFHRDTVELLVSCGGVASRPFVNTVCVRVPDRTLRHALVFRKIAVVTLLACEPAMCRQLYTHRLGAFRDGGLSFGLNSTSALPTDQRGGVSAGKQARGYM